MVLGCIVSCQSAKYQPGKRFFERKKESFDIKLTFPIGGIKFILLTNVISYCFSNLTCTEESVVDLDKC